MDIRVLWMYIQVCIHRSPNAIWIMSEYVIAILFFSGCWPRWVDNFSFYRTVERTEEKRARYIYWREGNKKTKRGKLGKTWWYTTVLAHPLLVRPAKLLLTAHEPELPNQLYSNTDTRDHKDRPTQRHLRENMV